LVSLIMVFSHFVAAAENFTIIAMPDTQYYSESYPEIYTNQTRWIVDNVDGLNIKMVIHEGDIVNTASSTTQWNNANTSMSILDNHVPYSIMPGNHDSGDLFSQYFPASRYSGESWWGGDYDNNRNNYQLLTINGQDWIFISIDFCPTSAEIQWANDMLNAYPDRRGILTTHGYLTTSGTRGSVTQCSDTQYIWDDLIKNHANLQIVLCGHMHGESRRTDVNLAGNTVYQMLADYQDETNGGNGKLRILTFVPDENKIYVKTYSPYTDSYQTGESSQFTLDYDLGELQVDYPKITLNSPANGAVIRSSQAAFNCSVQTNASLVNATLYFGLTNAGGSGSISVRISQSSDDAEEALSNNAVDITSTDLEFVNDSQLTKIQEVGLRFQNVNIPMGAAITSAYLEFEVDETGSDATSLNIYGQAVDNAATFTTTSSDITSRAKTSASAAWNNVPAWSTESEKKQSPDISPIIQEIVNRTGWSSGNSLAIIITGIGKRVAEAYDGESANAPLLVIQYVSEVNESIAWHAEQTQALSGIESSAVFTAVLN
jgi:hypothetical protein